MNTKFRKELKLGFREKLIILGPAVLLAILAFVVAYYFVDPFPPLRLSIGCGPPEGANFNFAQAYQEILSKEGITLDLRNTAGSAENLKMLAVSSSPRVHVAGASLGWAGYIIALVLQTLETTGAQ